MTQLRKGSAERTGLTRDDARVPGEEDAPAAAGSTTDVGSPMQNPAETAGVKQEGASAVMGEKGEIKPDDNRTPVKKPPPRPEDDGADKTRRTDRRPDGGPVDPAGSFVPGAVLPSSVPNASPNLKKKLNDMPNAADDPDRAKIPPELKI